MKPLRDLLDTADPAWPLVQEWIAKACVPVEALPAADPARGEALHIVQVTTRSPMGAIVYETGGLLIDHGWIRLLGSGHPRMTRSLPAWNLRWVTMKDGTPPPYLLIADDVVGGSFALDGGGLGIAPGKVAYFAPDSLGWETMNMGYSAFLHWCFSGSLAKYYADYRWEGWEKDVGALDGDRAFSIVPLPILRDVPFSARSRKAVPVEELYGLYQDVATQIRDLPDGSKVQLRIAPPKKKPHTRID